MTSENTSTLLRRSSGVEKSTFQPTLSAEVWPKVIRETEPHPQLRAQLYYTLDYVSILKQRSVNSHLLNRQLRQQENVPTRQTASPRQISRP